MFARDALQVLALPDYRLYWTGNTLSRLGGEMQQVALAWQVYALTNEPLSLGVIGLLRAGPALVLPILGGAAADAISRRTLLLLTQGLLLALSATLAALTLAGLANVWVLYGFVFAVALTTSFDGPAHGAVVPSLVPRELLPKAIAVNNLSWSTAGIVGPALGGVLLAKFGAGVVYAIDAGSFLAMIGALLGLRVVLPPPELAPEERGVRGHWRRIVEGFAFVRGQPVLLGLMSLDFAAVLLGAATVLLPVFAKDVLHVGPEGLGLLAAAPAAGAVAGALLVSLAGHPRRPGLAVLVAIAFYGLCVAGFGLSHVFWLSWVCLFGTGAADTVSMTLRQSIRQLLTPDPMRGRVGGINYVFAVSGTQLGEFEAGVAAQLFGASRAVAAGGLACVLLVALAAWRFPAIARFDGSAEPAKG